MKKVLALMLALMLTLSLVACASTEAPAAEGDAPAAEGDAPAAAGTGIYGSADETYYMNVPVSGVEYWFPVYAAFKEAGNMLGVNTVYGGTTEYDANLQVEAFNQMLAQNPTGIMVHPINAEPFLEPINRAVESGVAVITFASDSPDSLRSAYITSDNVQEGTAAARAIGDALGGEGGVMTCVNPGQTNHDIRTSTFKAVIEAEYPNMEFLIEAPTNQDPDAAYEAVMTEGQRSPHLAGIFTPEASSAIGAAQAAKELGTGILVMCADVNETVLDMLKTGDMFGAINPDQGNQGFWGMMLLFMSAHPEMVNFMSYKEDAGMNPISIPFMDNGLDIVNAENADSYYIGNYVEKCGYSSLDEMLAPGGPNA